MRIILASKSPRRKEILDKIGIRFEIVESGFEESIDTGKSPEDVVKYLAYKKAEDVAGKINSDALIIGADTVVAYNSIIMGKPQNSQDSFGMLKILSGNWHDVYTGVCIINPANNKCSVEYEVTAVKIRNLSDEEIYEYINTGEPVDKAGSYAIQGIGSMIVERIEGCYFNVVGLPIYKLSKLMEDFGVNLLKIRG